MAKLNQLIRTEERKEFLRNSANESNLWDCLNLAVDAIGNESTDAEIKTAAMAIYKNKGFYSLPWENRQQVFADYFN